MFGLWLKVLISRSNCAMRMTIGMNVIYKERGMTPTIEGCCE